MSPTYQRPLYWTRTRRGSSMMVLRPRLVSASWRLDRARLLERVWRPRLVQLPMLGGVRLSTPPASQPALAVVTTKGQALSARVVGDRSTRDGLSSVGIACCARGACSEGMPWAMSGG
jgi:hypothetical protein